jgi:hypothetical protein
VERSSPFFRGSELPRLCVLAAVAFVGWGLFWYFARNPLGPEERVVTATEQPEPLIADRSVEFETVTDRTPMGFRDSAAYSLLLGRARALTHPELAALCRRDVVLAHLWQTPELYRGIPIHIEGTAMRVTRYPASQSNNGWLYEAWIYTPDAPKAPYVGVFEEPPEGFPIGSSVSLRVVFNGYFLKLMKYQAGDVVRGAPVLVGRIGWLPPAPSFPLRWTLVALGAIFLISLFRWVLPLRRLFSTPARPRIHSTLARPQEVDPAALDAWLQSVGRGQEPKDEG